MMKIWKKRLFSLLMAIVMVITMLPVHTFALDDGEVCANHPTHTDCGYAPAVKGAACDHVCGEDCPTEAVTNCVHNHEEAGCTWVEAADAVSCGHDCSDGSCGYRAPVAAVVCTCTPELRHSETCASASGEACDCQTVTVHMDTCAPVEADPGQPCDFQHTGCGCAAAVAAHWGCGHTCSEDTGCVKQVCTHSCTDGTCGYVQGSDGSACTHSCETCDPKEPEEPALKLIEAWTWLDPDAYLTKGELDIPGASEEQVASLEVILSFLPAAIVTEAYGQIPVVFSCDAYPAEGACSGTYTFTAALPEGYALAEGAKALSVPVCLGNADTNAVYNNFQYESYGSGVIIHGYTGSSASITIPSKINGSSVIAIATYAFDGSGPQSVTIPNSVTEIQDYAFSKNTSIQSVTINGAAEIGANAFYNCTNLKTVKLDKTKVIGDHAFAGCPITSITLPETLHTIEGGAFAGCPLSSITIPDSVTSIGAYAFNGSTFTVIKLPRATQLSAGALAGCKNLTAIELKDTTSNYYTSKDGVLYSGTGELVAYPRAKSGSSFVIPNGVSRVRTHAFTGYINTNGDSISISLLSLRTVYVPHTVTRLDKEAFMNDSVSEYYFCGDAPSYSGSPISTNRSVTVYYAEGREGWDSTYAGKNTAIWPAEEHATEEKENGTVHPATCIEPAYTLMGCPRCDFTYKKFVEGSQATGNHSWNANGTCTVCGAIDNNNYCGDPNDNGGKNVVWEFDEETGTLTISGTGAMANYDDSLNKAPWRSYISDIVEVNVGDGVTTIGNYAFYPAAYLKNATLPESVTVIGDHAFSSCRQMKLTLPGKLVSIGDFAFSGCWVMAPVFPDTLTTIGRSAFSYCEWMKTLTIPDSVTSIGVGAFTNCTRLQSVTVGSGITALPYNVFASCAALTDVTLSSNVTEIGTSAFSYCRKLKTITGLKKVASIAYHAFYECNALESITIPTATTTIADYAFFNCTALKDVYYEGTKAEWDSINIDTRGNDPLLNATLHCVLASGVCGTNAFWTLYQDGTLHITGTGDINSYSSNGSPFHQYRDVIKLAIISDGITTIGKNLFFGIYPNLAYVQIPTSVTRIQQTAFGATSTNIKLHYQGTMAQWEDIYIVEYISYGNQYGALCSDGEILYMGPCGDDARFRLLSDGTLQVTGTGPMEFYKDLSYESHWSGDEQITKAEIGEGITTIDGYAFKNCSNLASVSLPASLKIISNDAFNGCSALTELAIPAGVTSISSSAFEGCSGLTTAALPASLTYLGSKAFSGCSSLEEVNIPAGVKSIYENTFDGCSSLEKVTIPEAVTRIDKSAFYGCSALTEIALPAGLTKIGSYAFGNCSGLTEIVLPDTLTTFDGGYIFYGCSGLTEITIPAGVTNLWSNTFDKCTNLEKVIFLGNCPTISDYAFSGVTTNGYYPYGNSTWTSDKLKNYGGTVTWTATQPEAVEYGITIGNEVVTSLLTSGEGWSYDPDTNTLSLSNHSWRDKLTVTRDDLTVQVDGAVSIYGLIAKNITLVGKTGISADTVTIPGNYYVSTTGDLTVRKLNLRVPEIKNHDAIIVGASGNTATGCFTIDNASVYATSTGEGEAATCILTGSIKVLGTSCVQTKNRMSGVPAIDVRGSGSSFSSQCHIIADGIAPGSGGWYTRGITLPAQGYFYESGDYVLKDTTGKNITSGDDFIGLDHVTCTPTADGTGHKLVCLCTNPTTLHASLPHNWSYALDGKDTITAECGECKATGSLKLLPPEELTCGGNTPREATLTGSIPGSKNPLISYTGDLAENGKPANAGSYTAKITLGGKTAQISYTITHNYALEVAQEAYLKSEATCTAKAVYYKSCVCGLASTTDTFVHGEPLDHEMSDWFEVTKPTPEADGEERSDCIHCDYYDTRPVLYTGPVVILEDEELLNQSKVWINGAPYPVTTDNGQTIVRVPENSNIADGSSLVIYEFHTGKAGDVHTQYPTGMKVWILEQQEDGNFTATRIPEFDNLLQYSGCSIRIVGVKGIRMITSIDQSVKRALTGSGLAGYTLLEYGTALCRASALSGGQPLVLGGSDIKSNHAYKKGVADPVFKYAGNQIQYTNVLVGFTDDDCKEDIAMRPYITLQDSDGQTVTIYGGIIYRSIGYIAYQNRNAFAVGSAAYEYVWGIIHHVYGDQYDADYKS